MALRPSVRISSRGSAPRARAAARAAAPPAHRVARQVEHRQTWQRAAAKGVEQRNRALSGKAIDAQVELLEVRQRAGAQAPPERGQVLHGETLTVPEQVGGSEFFVNRRVRTRAQPCGRAVLPPQLCTSRLADGAELAAAGAKVEHDGGSKSVRQQREDDALTVVREGEEPRRAGYLVGCLHQTFAVTLGVFHASALGQSSSSAP